MPIVGTDVLVASKIGTDIVINADHIKLALQHAFIKGASDNSTDKEKAGWDFAENLIKTMICNKERKRGL